LNGFTHYIDNATNPEIMWTIQHISTYADKTMQLVAWGQDAQQIVAALNDIKLQYMRQFEDYFGKDTKLVLIGDDVGNAMRDYTDKRYDNLLVVSQLEDNQVLPVFGNPPTATVYTVEGCMTE